MARTLDDHISAIRQIRDYAHAYEGKRKAFYVKLHAMLATPILRDDNYQVNVKRMYLAAIGALTAEIQPPTAKNYNEVLLRLNSALDGEKLGPINIAFYPDDGEKESYAIAGDEDQQISSMSRAEILEEALPRQRKLTKTQQALVDRFRAELPSPDRPFRARGPQRG